MHVGKGSTGLISVSIRQLCLLVTTHYLISHAVNGDVVKPFEFTVTHPNTHPAQRHTTSTLHVDDWHDVTTADDHVTENTDDLDLTDSSFSKTNETSVINASASAKKVNIADTGLVSMANVGSDVTSLVGRQVPDHVTLSTYMSPTSPSHAKNRTSDSKMRSSESGNSSQHPLPSVADDVLTSSHSGPSNNVTTPPPVTSTTADSSEGTWTWESSTTHVERETLQQTAQSSIDSLDQLMTSTNVTSPHHALVLIDRDVNDRSFTADVDIIALKEERSVVVISCLCGMLTSLLFVIIVFCLRDCSLRRLCQCVVSTFTHCCCCCRRCCQNDVNKRDGESLLLHGNPVNYDVTMTT